MKDNFKTFFFFLILIALSLVPFLSETIKEGKVALLEESENARALYTGKTSLVYNPLDEAFVITPKLKEMIKEEAELNFKNFKYLPIISVWIDPSDLYSEERGIFKYPLKKGRLWERASYLTYYERGEDLFSSFAGVRVHGGASRMAKDKSLRFYFRKSYGEESFLSNLKISFRDETPVKRLLLRRDGSLNFANDLSFSLIRKLGGMAPKMKYVAVYLNGEFYHLAQMMEHPHRDQVKNLYGQDDFLFYKLKGNNETVDRLLYEDAISRIKGEKKKDLFTSFNKMFDLNNITANLLTIMYTGTTDWAQGIYIREKKGGKWKLISWDFDFAFQVGPKSTPNLQIAPWEIQSFKIVMNQHVASLRHHLFKRLIHESPEYREYFVNKVQEMLSLDFTDEFLKEKFEEYQKIAEDLPFDKKLINDISYMKKFFKNRKNAFCNQMKEAIDIIPRACLKGNR